MPTPREILEKLLEDGPCLTPTGECPDGEILNWEDAIPTALKELSEWVRGKKLKNSWAENVMTVNPEYDRAYNQAIEDIAAEIEKE